MQENTRKMAHLLTRLLAAQILCRRTAESYQRFTKTKHKPQRILTDLYSKIYYGVLDIIEYHSKRKRHRAMRKNRTENPRSTPASSKTALTPRPRIITS